MERLTRKNWRNLDPWEKCGQDNYCKRGCHEQGGCTKGCIVPRIYDRLAAYEELMERWKLRSIEEADRIFHRVNALGGIDLMAQYRAIGSIDHLRDLLQAEQDGRLVVLPCKVGDTIYYTREGCPIVEHLKVRTFFVGDPTRRGKILHLHMIRTDKFDVSMDALGKTVFLTREEAETALKGGEG